MQVMSPRCLRATLVPLAWGHAGDWAWGQGQEGTGGWSEGMDGDSCHYDFRKYSSLCFQMPLFAQSFFMFDQFCSNVHISSSHFVSPCRTCWNLFHLIVPAGIMLLAVESQLVQLIHPSSPLPPSPSCLA